jgi:quinol monooxygenase YgiN
MKPKEQEKPQPDRVSSYIEQFGALLREPAKPFTIVARFSVKDGTQAKLEAALARARAATHCEPGVIAYDLNRDTADSARYLVYERWKSLADLEVHLRTLYIAKLMEEIDEVLAAAPEFNVFVPSGE